MSIRVEWLTRISSAIDQVARDSVSTTKFIAYDLSDEMAEVAVRGRNCEADETVDLGNCLVSGCSCDAGQDCSEETVQHGNWQTSSAKNWTICLTDTLSGA